MSVDARPTHRRGVGRALLALALLCAGGAVWLGLEARDRPDPDQVTLDVETAVATTPPSTIAPRTSTEPVMTTDDASPVTSSTAVPPPTTVPLSPLAELLGPAGSAIPPRPTALVIPSIDVLRPVRAVELEDDGGLECPTRPRSAGTATARAGRPRCDGARRPRDLEPHARSVLPSRRDGARRTCRRRPGRRVDPRVRGDPSAPSTTRTNSPAIASGSAPGGIARADHVRWELQPDIRRYRQNIVVCAVPVDQIEAAAT
ncbi:MAG: hypothetical protein R2705_25595 [Ilumatobacteraceae bacterium]